MLTAEPAILKRWAGPAVIALLLLTGFFLFTTPIEDSDSFWHVATGQWIWEHKSLPTTDPFTHTFRMPEAGTAAADRLHFYLSQYWLGQLALAAAWSIGGVAGIILLRALIFTAILVVLYRWLNRSTNLPTTLVFLLLTAVHLHQYANDRPQLFTLLLMPVVLRLLERLRESASPGTGYWVTLPALMLLWANLHGGYILGVAIILIYLMFQILALTGKTMKQGWKAPAIMALAIAASQLNPCGPAAFRETYLSMSQSGQSNVLEFLPTLQVAVEHGINFPAYWATLAIICLIGVFRYKAMELPHLFTLFFLTALSLSAMRFTPFLLFAAPLAVIYIPEIPRTLLRGLAIAATIFLGVNVNWEKVCRFRSDNLNPAGAAAFMKSALPAQNTFNYYDWGGYLLLYAPGYKTFIDGRNVDASVLKRYKEALWGKQWKEVFAEFNVNTVIMPAVGEFPPATYPLAMSLATSSSWTLVYSDATALVFVRNIPQNQQVIARHAMDKAGVQTHILSLLDLFPPASRKKAEFWISRGNAQMMLGEYAAAATSFRESLAIDPANEWARMMLRNAPR